MSLLGALLLDCFFLFRKSCEAVILTFPPVSGEESFFIPAALFFLQDAQLPLLSLFPGKQKEELQLKDKPTAAKQVVDEEFVRRINMSKFSLESFKCLMNPRDSNYRIFGHKSGCGTAAVSAAASSAVPLVVLIQLSAWPGCELDQQVACEKENEPKTPKLSPKT